MCNFPQFGSLSLFLSLAFALPFSLPFHFLPLPLAVPSCPLLCLRLSLLLSSFLSRRFAYLTLFFAGLPFSVDPPRLCSPLLTYLNETRSRHYEYRNPSHIRQRCAVTRHSRDSKSRKEQRPSLILQSLLLSTDLFRARQPRPCTPREREREMRK